MSLCPRGCGRPSRRVLSTMNRKKPPLCLECSLTDGRGRSGDKSAAAKLGNARRAEREAAWIEAQFAAALAEIRNRRVSA